MEAPISALQARLRQLQASAKNPPTASSSTTNNYNTNSNNHNGKAYASDSASAMSVVDACICDLKNEYMLSTKRHPLFPSLVLFKYKQGVSPFENEIVQECRGIILDSNDNWNIVCYPYKKFFNYGEPNAAVIDWTSAVVTEKLDGSLVTLYWYQSGWQVSSTGTPDGGSNLSSDLLFSELFWDIWKKKNYKLPPNPSSLQKNKKSTLGGGDICYMFEMVSPRHTIIVQPDDEDIVFHGARNLRTLQELDPFTVAKENGWNCVKMLPIHSIEEVVSAAKILNPIKAEGFVVRDAHFNRLKIKSPNYVALSHLGGSSMNEYSVSSMLQLIKTKESIEYLTYFPDARFIHGKVSTAYNLLLKQLEADYELVMKALADKKSNLKQQNGGVEVEDFNQNEFVNLELKRNLETIPKNLKDLRLDYCRIIFTAFGRQMKIIEVIEAAETSKVVPLVAYFLEDDMKRQMNKGDTYEKKKKKKNKKQRERKKLELEKKAKEGK